MTRPPFSRFPHRIPFPAACPAILLAVCLTVCILGGCAAKTAPEPEAQTGTMQARTAQTDAAEAPAITSSGRSAQASPPPVTESSVASGFYTCIDARKGFGPVRLGMSVEEVRTVAPWLDIDPLNSALLSTEILTLCGERIWNYKVRFDASCRVRTIWFTGPKRLGNTIKQRCSSTVKGDGDPLSSFLWHCESTSTFLNAVELDAYRNIYRLLRTSEPENQGRCMLPRYWD